MKKILSLFALGLMASAGAMAQQVVQTPKVSTAKTHYYYTFHCESKDAHLTEHYLGEVAGVIIGRAQESTRFEFETADGGFYMKSVESGKYVNWTGSATLTDTPETTWTISPVTDGHGCQSVGLIPSGYSQSLNNNVETSPYLQLRAYGASNYCSLWCMQEYVEGSITNLDELSNDMTYTLQNNRRGWWTGKEGSDNIWQTDGLNGSNTHFDSGSGKTQNATDKDQQWAILKSEQGNYYLYNVGQNKFFASSDTYATANAKALLATEVNGAVVLSNETGTCTGTWLTTNPTACWAIGKDVNGTNHFFGVTNWEGQNWQVFEDNTDFANNNDEGMYFSIVTAEAFDAATKAAVLEAITHFENNSTTVTYTYVIDGVTYGSVDVEATIGEAYPEVPSLPAFCTVTAYPEGLVTEQTTKELVLTQELPFEVGKAYHLGVRLNNDGTLNKYVQSNGTNAQTGSYGSNLSKASLWYFTRVENTADQFYLNSVQNGGVSTDNGAKSVFGTATPLKIYEFTHTAAHKAGNNDFGFVNPNRTSDIYGDHKDGYLGNWSNGRKDDNGSAFRVVEISDEELNALATEAPEDPYVGYVGHHDAIEVPVYSAANVAAVKADATPANVIALFDEITTGRIEAYDVDLDFNKIYRIVDFFGRVANAAPVEDAEGNLSNKGTIVTADKKDADTFFRFVEAGDNVKIQHVNSGLYFGTPGHGSQIQFVEEAEAAEFAMTPKAGANLKWLFKKGSEYINNNSTLYRFDGWNSDGDGSQLNVVEVGALSVTIGEAGVATLCSPVNLTVPEGVTVYTAQVVGDYLVAEVLKNHIPAGAAVILEAAADTYDFQFVSGAAPVENNDLLGTCVAKVKADGDLVLGVDSENEVGFYSLADDVANLAANKAYIHVDPAAASNGLRISFDELTSILSAAQQNGGQAIFDLQGRRVVSAKGLNIVNGKKVIK